jgi:hypothetical protein
LTQSRTHITNCSAVSTVPSSSTYRVEGVLYGLEDVLSEAPVGVHVTHTLRHAGGSRFIP